MLRTVVGAVIGTTVGLLLLACWGGSDGYVNGLPSARLAPGLEAAVTEALVVPLFYFWMGMLPGAVIGGIAGFGSWLVRPRGSALPNSFGA
jgi:hypothetical protein